MRTFITLLVAASILTSCNNLSPTAAPTEPVARFHSSGWKFVSLNEQNIRDVLQPDLSKYHMPDDFPFIFKDSSLYLNAPMGDRTVPVGTDFAVPKHCTPSLNLSQLLCATPDNILIKNLPSDVQSAAIPVFQKHGGFYKDFFIITIGNPEIYVLPNNKFQYNTGCQWLAKNRISCRTGHGTGVWTTAIFDLQLKKYLPLPHDGANILDDSDFSRGYIYLRSPDTTDERMSIYNLDNVLLYEANVKYRLITEDTVVVLEPCENGEVCLHYLQFDGLKITRDLVTKLNVALDDTKSNYIQRIPEGFVVTTANKVFLINKDTLQITQSLDFPQPEQTWFDLYKVIAQKYGHLLIAEAKPIWPDSDLLAADRKVIIFDLDKCQGALDQPCAIKTWDKSFKLSDDGNMYEVLRHVYYPFSDSPNLIYIYDKDLEKFAIYNLDNANEVDLHLEGASDLIASSTDGRFLLVATKPDVFAPPETRHYYLIDLTTKRVIDTKMNVDENLFFVHIRV